MLSAELPRALAQLGQPAAFHADVKQVLLEKLLVGPQPKIKSYAGTGALRPWLRSAALRTAIDLVKYRHPEQDLDQGRPIAAAVTDPELAHFRRRFSGPLKAAVEKALAALSLEERNALRFYYLDGMTVAEIGRMRGLDKSNVSRAIARTRKAVLAEVKRTLVRDHGLEAAELDSVMRLMQSQLSVSVERVLGKARSGKN